MPSRSSSVDRRAAAVRAGVGAFADLGLTSAAVRRAAEAVGVSSAYLFRMFGSQRDFFLACLDHVEEELLTTLTSAADSAADPFAPLSAAFREFLGDGRVTGLWLQACAVARDDAEIARRCRRLLAAGLRAAAATTGASTDRLSGFLARGTLMMTLQAVAAPHDESLDGGVGAVLAEFG